MNEREMENIETAIEFTEYVISEYFNRSWYDFNQWFSNFLFKVDADKEILFRKEDDSNMIYIEELEDENEDLNKKINNKDKEIKELKKQLKYLKENSIIFSAID